MSGNKKTSSPFVYSTDPGFTPPIVSEDTGNEELPAAQQKIKVMLQTKNRGGKAVTLVHNFIGTLAEEEELGKKLKSFCGTGGSVKDGEIMVQGDNRDKVLQWLLKNGFKAAKKI